MKSRSVPLRLLVYLLFLSLICLTGCGPAEISGSLLGVGDKYECVIPILKCPQQNQNLKVVVNRPPQVQNCYSVRKNLKVGDPIYCDKSWVIKDIGFDKLKGADLIVSRFNFDNSNNSPVFLDIQPLDKIDSVYVAYDSRAQKKPDWLTKDYKQVVSSGGPLYIKIFQQDKLVNLEIWRKEPTPEKNDRFTVPGNFAGYPSGWPQGFNLGDAAMYAVIVKPLQTGNCNNINPAQDKIGTYSYSPYPYCPSNIKDAEQEALTECQRGRKPFETCSKPNCITEMSCADPDAVGKTTGLTVQPLSFLQSSEIEFNPTKYKSVADINILGNKYTKNVTGTLHFEYLLNDLSQLREMQVNGMLLKVDPLNTKAGTFTDIVIDLLAPVKAYCKDKNPPWATPCDWYQIRKGEFLASEAATEGGKHLLFATYNLNPVDIKIDHSTRTFQIKGGPLTTTVKVNGKDTTLDIDIDLFGHFLNFAPQALGKESTNVVECAEDRNRDPVFLDAGASFEIYNDPIPNSAYKWYEDYGLVTEKFWGQGSKVTIGTYQLSFGVHDITLAIRDSHGITDTDTFKVEVRDKTPPDLNVPKDVFIVPERPGPVKVNIGKAGASDVCSSNVMITNDAPEDLLFPQGVVTDVTWRADDGRGNVTEKIQKVNVFSAGGNMPQDPKLETMPPPGGDKMPQDPKLEPAGAAARCDQYARTAISQNQENISKACGFKGPAWSENYTNHYDWCMRVPREQSDAGTKQRADDLTNSCAGAQPEQPQGGGSWSGPEARCDQYAKTAISQNQQNISKGCGFGGPRWSSDYNHHYKWCVNIPKQTSDFETSERDKEIKECSGTRSPGLKNEGVPVGPDARCDQYAKTAISQNQQNMEKACGFTGPAWVSEYSHHYDWCVRVDKEQADAGTKMRSDDLQNKCRRIQ